MVYMAETYCGKNCADCVERQQLNCPGCRMGPGRAYCGDCSIAKCCISRGHYSCASCSTASTCFNLKSSHRAAEDRLRKHKAEAEKQRRLLERSKLLGNWLWVLFWFVLTANIAGVVFSFLENQPGMRIPNLIVTVVTNLVYAFLLLKLSKTSDCFRTAGICTVIVVVIELISSLFHNPVLIFVVSMVLLVPAFMASYQRYMGYAEVTEELDEDMGRKWTVLWYWTLGSTIAMAVGLIMSLGGSLLGALAVLLSAVLTLVIAVLEVIYLYCTAKMFREYVEENKYVC